MKEYAFGEQLFIADDGRPMEFYLRCQEKEELEEYIKHAGGSLVRHPGSFTIIIEDASQDTPTATLESFKSDFIIQCCIQNKILPLKQFWCNPVTSFSADFDPNLVLHRKISWIDARIKFKTGTEEPDSDASVTENDGEEPHTRPYKPRKNSRTEFTRQDQKKIVDYIVKNKLFTDVKGTAMWMRMEQKLKNHTWQSLKEHFLKKILPVINTFNLSEAEVGWFRCSAAVKNPKPRQQRRAYSHEEDKRILKYVSIHADERTYLWGNVFWQLMEKKNTVPGRTWYSLKERYTKYLAPGKRSEYKNDETASDSNEIENVPSSPEEASASACCKRGSSAPGKASSSAWLTNNVSSKPGSASESVFKIKSVSLIPKTSIPSTSMCKMKSVSAVPEAASSSAGEMNSVSSTPEKTSTIASKTKSAPLTPREPSSACKKSCQNDEEGSPIPLKTKKRKLFDASSAVLPDFSPVFVKETGPSWLEKKFNNSTNKKFGKLAAMVTQLQDVPENLPVNVHTQNDEDVPNLDSVDLFASSSNNQDSTSSRIQNEPSETCGRDQIPVPANDDDCGQKEKDVQHFGSVDLFASSNANNQAQSSRKEGEMSPVQHRSSDHDQGTESEWPSNFPPEPVHFISDSENDPADEGFEGDTDDGIDNVTSDSEWSDDGLFWRGGVEFPDGLRKKRHPFAHLNPVPMMDFITLHKGRTEEQSKANRNQSEVDKQDSTVSRKLSLPKNISKVAPKTISEQPNNIRVRRVADPFLPKLSNSYDPSQMSVINCSGASSSVGTHQEQAHQHKNSLTTESNSSNNCQEAIIDKFKSVGVQPTVGDKRDVSVQTDPVLVLPMNWRSKFPNFEKQIFLSSSTDDLQLEPPEPTTLHAGCPSPAPANCSPSSDSDE